MNKKSIISLLALFSALMIVSAPALVLGQTSTGDEYTNPDQTVPQNITSLSGILDLIMKIANWIWIFLLILSFVFILIAAFSFLTSAGNPEKVASARQMIVYAVVAIAIGALAYGIPLIVKQLLTST
jgi:hypothetical protein